MRRRSRVAAQEAPAAAYARGYSAGQAASPTPPTFTLGTVADQVDLSAPTMPSISSLVATGTPTYAWTLADPLGADASALLTGPTTATPTCAALSTWTGAYLCGRWTGTVTVTDSTGSTVKSFGWTVGVSGRMRRASLAFTGSKDFIADPTPYVIGGVTITPYNTANADVFEISGGALRIQPKDAGYGYTSGGQSAPRAELNPTELNPSYTSESTARIQFLVSHPSTGAGQQQTTVGIGGESASSFSGVRLHGHSTTRYLRASVFNASSDSLQSNVNTTAGLVVLLKKGRGYTYWTAAEGSGYREEGDAALTKRLVFASDNKPAETDNYDGGEKIVLAAPHGGSTNSTPEPSVFSGVRLDVEV